MITQFNTRNEVFINNYKMKKVFLILAVLAFIGCSKDDEQSDNPEYTTITYEADYTGDLSNYNIFIYLQPETESAPVHQNGTANFSYEFTPPNNMDKAKFYCRVTAPGQLEMRIRENGEIVAEKSETIPNDVIVKQVQLEYILN